MGNLEKRTRQIRAELIRSLTIPGRADMHQLTEADATLQTERLDHIHKAAQEVRLVTRKFGSGSIEFH